MNRWLGVIGAAVEATRGAMACVTAAAVSGFVRKFRHALSK